MTDALQWLAPWAPATDAAVCAALERQFHVELSDRHVLFGAEARLSPTATTLSRTPRRGGHLTWRNRTEEDPRWPATAVFASR